MKIAYLEEFLANIGRITTSNLVHSVLIMMEYHAIGRNIQPPNNLLTEADRTQRGHLLELFPLSVERFE